MIPRALIIEWKEQAPWPLNEQVEHDLVLSKVICELYSDAMLSEHLVFRGGTALNKLYFEKSARFSEDLDFVQMHPGPIGPIINMIRDKLDVWLGQPKWKHSQGNFTLYYSFETEFEPVVQRKVKIEINTREHFFVYDPVNKPIEVKSR